MKYVAGVAIVALAVLAWMGSSVPVSAQAAASTKPNTLDGKELFLSQGCNSCHAVSTVDIAAKMKSSKAPDLAQTGKKREVRWLSDFLRQQTDSGGKKHPKAFTGSDEQLGALLGWLQEHQKK